MTFMEVKGHQRSNGVNCVLWLPYLGHKTRCKLRMMIFMEVKGHQRSNGVNVYGYYILSKEAMMQAENDDDLNGGQRSSKVKWGKICAMVTIFGQKKCRCKLRISGVSWGVHSVRLHPGVSKRGAKKEGRKRKKQGKGEKKGKEKGRQRRREGKGKKICKRKGKEGRNQKKIGYKKKNTRVVTRE